MDGLSLIGGRPSLDFVNSEGGSRNGPPERLSEYADLARWCVHAGVVGEEVARRWLEQAGERPEEATGVHARALELREALYRLFAAAIEEVEPAAADLEVFHRELGEALARLRVVPTGDGYGWRFVASQDRLDRPLWTLVRDAADLLGSDLLARVKECGGRDCVWLFLDESRNRSRRWCQMGVCGNRAKARRHYRRVKQGES